MNTKKFRTKQEFVKKINPKGKNYIIGLDAGYSGMKVFHENGYFCFPSFVKKITEEMLPVPNEKDILFEDLETRKKYMLGYTAQEMLSPDDTNDTDGEFLSRKRYKTEKFRILCWAAIGLALMDKKDNREVAIQTGLPASYVDGDSKDLKQTLAAPAHFAIKVGNERMREFRLSIKEENIFCMPQPAGSLYSVLIKPDGSYVANAKDYLLGNVLIMDIGFGTFDFYGLKNRAVVCKESLNSIGMHEVLKRTAKKILHDMNEDIRIQALQKNLESGTVICVNEEEMKTEEKPLSPLLDMANDETFEDAFVSAKGVTNAFRDYKYVIITGGTGEAWYEKIKEKLSGMKTLTIIPGNINDHLPFIYSNVRGYYLFRLNCKP